MSVTGPGYPIAYNACGPCDRCGRYVCLSAMSNGVVTHHECDGTVADEPKLVINYEREAEKMDHSQERAYRPGGLASLTQLAPSAADLTRRPPIVQTDEEKLRERRNALIQVGREGRLTPSLKAELDYLTDHLEVE